MLTATHRFWVLEFGCQTLHPAGSAEVSAFNRTTQMTLIQSMFTEACLVLDRSRSRAAKAAMRRVRCPARARWSFQASFLPLGLGNQCSAVLCSAAKLGLPMAKHTQKYIYIIYIYTKHILRQGATFHDAGLLNSDPLCQHALSRKYQQSKDGSTKDARLEKHIETPKTKDPFSQDSNLSY